MKKIDQYLLEHYPSVWNTKLVPMLLLALCGHLFFFLWGFITFSKERIYSEYIPLIDFWGLPSLLSFVITLLLLVYWLMQLSKNNAFKHFYPSTPLKLFGQFVQYFVIVFASISFYISFVSGSFLSSHLSFLNEPQSEMWYKENSIIEIISQATPFWMVALSIALLVLCVRITNVRLLLLTIVFSGVLALVLGIISLVITITGDIEGVVWFYIIAYIGIAIVGVSLIGQVSKLISGIILNFTLLYFIPTLSAVIGVILQDNLEFRPMYYFVVFITFAFVWLYAPILHQWKASQE